MCKTSSIYNVYKGKRRSKKFMRERIKIYKDGEKRRRDEQEKEKVDFA